MRSSSTSWTTNDNTMSRSKTFEESSRRQSWKKETEDFEDEMRSRAKVSIQKAENKLKLEALSDASKRYNNNNNNNNITISLKVQQQRRHRPRGETSQDLHHSDITACDANF